VIREETETTMKNLLLATVAIATLATPAFAQTASHHRADRDSYAAAPNGYTTDGYARVRVGTRSGDVYDTRGQYIGSDPDVTVRDQLARDPSQGD
jgi:hypothetical protein